MNNFFMKQLFIGAVFCCYFGQGHSQLVQKPVQKSGQKSAMENQIRASMLCFTASVACAGDAPSDHSSSRGVSRHHSKKKPSYSQSRPMKRPGDGRGYTQRGKTFEEESKNSVAAISDEEQIFESDPEVEACVEEISLMYASKNLFPKRSRKRIPELMHELTLWFLRMKNEPLQLTREELKSIIKRVLPLSVTRQEKQSSMNNELHVKIERFYDKYCGDEKAICDNLVRFVSNTIAEMICLFAQKKLNRKSLNFAQGKQDRWLRDDIADGKALYEYQETIATKGRFKPIEDFELRHLEAMQLELKRLKTMLVTIDMEALKKEVELLERELELDNKNSEEDLELVEDFNALEIYNSTKSRNRKSKYNA